QKVITAFGDHHRIEHDVPCLVAAQALRNHLCDPVGGHHADLDRIDANVLEHRVDLVSNEIGIERNERSYALRVLRDDSGDRSHCIGPQGRKRLYVGLNACAPCGIGAGDAEHIGDHDVATSFANRAAACRATWATSRLSARLASSSSSRWNHLASRASSSATASPDFHLHSTAIRMK